MKRPPRQGGFSLLEVLVALAIVGLLFTGISGLLRSQIAVQEHMERKLAAAQLAWNLVQTFHLEGSPARPELLEGEGEMGHFLLPWRRQVWSDENSPERKVSVTIGTDDEVLFVAHSTVGAQ